jgi:hypothetical protein
MWHYPLLDMSYLCTGTRNVSVEEGGTGGMREDVEPDGREEGKAKGIRG